MNLIELTPIPVGALPLAEFKDHLRLGTGFTDDALQDGVLVQSLRAAVAAIEARTSKALFLREFRWQVTLWRHPLRVTLPVAPVLGITELRSVLRDGSEVIGDQSNFYVRPDAHAPELSAATGCLPTVPAGGRIEVDFPAGFAAEWPGIPADLRQALFYLAADFHEHRHDTDGKGGMPPRVQHLLSSFLPRRISGGAR